MFPYQLRLSSALIPVALVAIPFSANELWGWPGNVFLSFTQLPIGWLSCTLIGFVIGQGVGWKAVPEKTPRLSALLAIMWLGVLAVLWVRSESPGVFQTRTFPTYHPVYWMDRFDEWLRFQSFVPRFWKANCTHTPVKIVLGAVVSGLCGASGVLTGIRLRISRGRSYV